MIRLGLLGDERKISAALMLAPRLQGVELEALDGGQLSDEGALDGIIADSSASMAPLLGAAAQGKHILVAEPRNSFLEMRALAEACQSHNARFMAGFLDRFRPSVQTVKQSLESGQLGQPGLLRIHRWNAQASPTTDIVADIDLAIWMFQAMPEEVYGVSCHKPGVQVAGTDNAACHKPGVQVGGANKTARRVSEDEVSYLQLHLGFPGSGMAMIDVSSKCTTADGYYSLSLIGSAGAAYADDHHNQQLLFRGEQPTTLKTGEGTAPRLGMLREFADAINQQREPSVTSSDARAASLVCEAAQHSMEWGIVARQSGEHYEC